MYKRIRVCRCVYVHGCGLMCESMHGHLAYLDVCVVVCLGMNKIFISVKHL